ALAASGPFMLAGYLLMPLLLHAQTPTIVVAARWYLIIVVILASEGMLAHPLRGRGDFAAWNSMRVFPAAMGVAAMALAWVVGRRVPTFVATELLVAQALLLFP